MQGREKLISCIGDAYFPSILNLFGSLLTLNPAKEYNNERKSFSENGLSVSIILLCVAMIESYINRIRYFSNNKQ